MLSRFRNIINKFIKDKKEPIIIGRVGSGKVFFNIKSINNNEKNWYILYIIYLSFIEKTKKVFTLSEHFFVLCKKF